MSRQTYEHKIQTHVCFGKHTSALVSIRLYIDRTIRMYVDRTIRMSVLAHICVQKHLYVSVGSHKTGFRPKIGQIQFDVLTYELITHIRRRF
jgi:hypothetical protein